MSKYRIVKLGDTNSYMVQEKVFWFFWHTRMGDIISLSLPEAREYVTIFEKSDEYQKAKKAKNTIVPNQEN
jgi:hypothetical protein